jgi:hypothetical protein
MGRRRFFFEGGRGLAHEYFFGLSLCQLYVFLGGHDRAKFWENGFVYT